MLDAAFHVNVKDSQPTEARKLRICSRVLGKWMTVLETTNDMKQFGDIAKESGPRHDDDLTYPLSRKTGHARLWSPGKAAPTS